MKKRITLAVGAVSASLALAGCSGKSESPDGSYEVKGKVHSKWIDYECKKHTPLMGTVVFMARTPKPRPKEEKKSKETREDVSPDRKTPKPVRIPASEVPTGKPEKPRGFSAKKCSTEYELYIENEDGVFEQDVSYEDYEKCDKGEKFSRCVG